MMLLEIDKRHLIRLDDQTLESLVRLGDSERGSGYLLLLLLEEQSYRAKLKAESSLSTDLRKDQSLSTDLRKDHNLLIIDRLDNIVRILERSMAKFI